MARRRRVARTHRSPRSRAPTNIRWEPILRALLPQSIRQRAQGQIPIGPGPAWVRQFLIPPARLWSLKQSLFFSQHYPPLGGGVAHERRMLKVVALPPVRLSRSQSNLHGKDVQLCSRTRQSRFHTPYGPAWYEPACRLRRPVRVTWLHLRRGWPCSSL